MTLAGQLTSLVEVDGLNRMIVGADGDFYGTTSYGGSMGYGTVWKLNQETGSLTTLAEFTGSVIGQNGVFPWGELTKGSDGNLYGTTAGGGSEDFGTIFKMTQSGELSTLVNFSWDARNVGFTPVAGLVEGTHGDFYGTASS